MQKDFTIEDDLALTKEELRRWRRRANRAESLLRDAQTVFDKFRSGFYPDKLDYAIMTKVSKFITD